MVSGCGQAVDEIIFCAYKSLFVVLRFPLCPSRISCNLQYENYQVWRPLRISVQSLRVFQPTKYLSQELLSRPLDLQQNNRGKIKKPHDLRIVHTIAIGKCFYKPLRFISFLINASSLPVCPFTDVFSCARRIR